MSETTTRPTINKTYRPSLVPVRGDYMAQKVRILRIARGIPTTVPADRVSAHIEWLRGIGFLDDAIAAAAGVTASAVHKMRTEKYATTQIDRATRVLSVTHIPVPEQAALLVPAIGVRRRIEALWAIGHASKELGLHLGVTGQMVSQYHNVANVRGSTWVQISALYERLSGTPGSSTQSIRLARKKGYAPPIAWEGHDIDHPDHVPDLGDETDSGGIDEVLLARILSGKHDGSIGKAERDAVLDYAVEKGWNRTDLAPVLRLSRESADRALVRHRDKLRKKAA